eukprot:scaffold2134_cov384-Prasinococcus_capsulatus_cf.AAC.16
MVLSVRRAIATRAFELYRYKVYSIVHHVRLFACTHTTVAWPMGACHTSCLELTRRIGRPEGYPLEYPFIWLWTTKLSRAPFHSSAKSESLCCWALCARRLQR